MSKITVRRAEPGDGVAVVRLLRQIADLHHEGRPDMFKTNRQKYNEEEYAAILKEKDRPVFVAVGETGDVLGHCFLKVERYEGHSVFIDHSTLFIDDICVDNNCRGQGIGHMLFAAAKAYAEQIGVYNIELNVWEFNDGAVRFYESHGFKTRSRIMELIL